MSRSQSDKWMEPVDDAPVTISLDDFIVDDSPLLRMSDYLHAVWWIAQRTIFQVAQGKEMDTAYKMMVVSLYDVLSAENLSAAVTKRRIEHCVVFVSHETVWILVKQEKLPHFNHAVTKLKAKQTPLDTTWDVRS